MACTSPLPAYITYDSDGKIQYQVKPRSSVAFNDDGSPSSKFIYVPCGHCMSCRLARAKEWSNRCLMEMQYHEQSLFLTLTYDDEHLPGGSIFVSDEETGEIKAEVHSLVKKDLTDFIKRLRYVYDGELRYLACGEYGSKSYRPHFHLIVFGLNLNDLNILKRNFQGDLYYTSPTISKIWKHGFHTIGEVTSESAGYVARYTTKKLLGKDGKLYDKYNIVPPFLTMSLKPGIGYNFYLDNKEKIYEFDNFIISTNRGSQNCSVPRYFRKCMEREEPQRYIEYMARREERQIECGFLNEYDYFEDEKKILQKWQEFDNIDDNLNKKLGHIKERSAV